MGIWVGEDGRKCLGWRLRVIIINLYYEYCYYYITIL